MAVVAPVSCPHMQQSTSASYVSAPSTTSSQEDCHYFALAKIRGEVRLVQIALSTPPSSLTLVDVKIFKHEWTTIFRYVEDVTLHPNDIKVFEEISEQSIKYEESTGVAFLAPEMVDRLRRLSTPMPYWTPRSSVAAESRKTSVGRNGSRFSRKGMMNTAEQARMLQARYGGAWMNQR